MLLTAQNKSAAAIGQAAMPGDFNPIKDLYQTEVGDLCRWRNDARRDWMLGPVDAMPALSQYSPDDSALDGILRILLDENGTVGDCVAAGYDQQSAREAAEHISVSQPQMHRSAPGPQLTATRAPYPTGARWRDAS